MALRKARSFFKSCTATCAIGHQSVKQAEPIRAFDIVMSMACNLTGKTVERAVGMQMIFMSSVGSGKFEGKETLIVDLAGAKRKARPGPGPHFFIT